jgi:hypothetical protein
LSVEGVGRCGFACTKFAFGLAFRFGFGVGFGFGSHGPGIRIGGSAGENTRRFDLPKPER